MQVEIGQTNKTSSAGLFVWPFLIAKGNDIFQQSKLTIKTRIWNKSSFNLTIRLLKGNDISIGLNFKQISDLFKISANRLVLS